MPTAPRPAVPTSWWSHCTGAPSTCTRRPRSSAQLADRLTASNDVDVVYGHHAHVVQPVTKVHGKWVVYGLGNTVAAHSVRRLDNREGLLVRVQLVQSGGRWRSGRLDWVPSYLAESPYRWVNLTKALHDGGLSPSTRAVYATSAQRIEKVVDSLGAADDGAHPLAP